MSAAASSVEDRMRARLAVLEPESLDIADDSAKHAGHEGAKSGGGHYQLVIVSSLFTGTRPQARHRMVYDALGPMMQREIHALSIKAFAPHEL